MGPNFLPENSLFQEPSTVSPSPTASFHTSAANGNTSARRNQVPYRNSKPSFLCRIPRRPCAASRRSGSPNDISVSTERIIFGPPTRVDSLTFPGTNLGKEVNTDSEDLRSCPLLVENKFPITYQKNKRSITNGYEIPEGNTTK